MRLLLDTQVMLWWLLDDPRLKSDTRQLISGNSCLVSVASIWEVAISAHSHEPFQACLGDQQAIEGVVVDSR